MPAVIQLSEQVVKSLDGILSQEHYNKLSSELQFYLNDYFLENSVWVSITDPINKHISTPKKLKDVPRLEMSFYDVKKIAQTHVWDEKTNDFIIVELYPPSYNDAIKIVDFIEKEHKGKNVIVNCMAGVSRSGAVAKFCENELGYEWPIFFKDSAYPNDILYTHLCNYFREKMSQET